jgi:hypothetical protein
MRISYSSSVHGENESLPSLAALGRRSFLRGLSLFSALALLALFGGLAAADSNSANKSAIPANIEPPEGAVLLFELDAVGDQIYTCEAKPDDAAAYVWTFKAPEADLINSRGDVVGTHFAGPTWQGLDGSAVIASVLERADAPKTGTIPWLLLEAKDHAGSGAFSTITYIQRLSTVGGTAPADGCDADHAGDEVRAPYEATYAFYYAASSAAN